MYIYYYTYQGTAVCIRNINNEMITLTPGHYNRLQVFGHSNRLAQHVQRNNGGPYLLPPTTVPSPGRRSALPAYVRHGVGSVASWRRHHEIFKRLPIAQSSYSSHDIVGFPPRVRVNWYSINSATSLDSNS